MASQELVQVLFLRHSDQLRGYITAMTGNLQDAEDVLQDVFLVMTAKAGDFSEGTDYGAWVRAIARYQALQQRGRRRGLGLAPDVAALVADTLDEDGGELLDAELTALRACLGRLGPAARRLLAMRYADDLAPADIAARNGRSANAVAVALSKVRTALRDCIERRLAGRA